MLLSVCVINANKAGLKWFCSNGQKVTYSRLREKAVES